MLFVISVNAVLFLVSVKHYVVSGQRKTLCFVLFVSVTHCVVSG